MKKLTLSLRKATTSYGWKKSPGDRCWARMDRVAEQMRLMLAEERETFYLFFWGGGGGGRVQESRRCERRTEKGGRLSHVHLPLYPYVLQGISLTVSVGGSRRLTFNSSLCNSEQRTPDLERFFLTLPVVEEELLSLQNGSFGKDSDAVVSVHHDHCEDVHQDHPLKVQIRQKRCKFRRDWLARTPARLYLLRSSWD